MGRGSGTGSPNWFRCGHERKGLGAEHNITLTGRTKPYNPPRSLGSRSTFTSYEYECSCGHVGWSNHIDLARMAMDAEALRATGRRA